MKKTPIVINIDKLIGELTINVNNGKEINTDSVEDTVKKALLKVVDNVVKEYGE